MIRIKCINPNCTARDRIFSWNERRHLEVKGRLAREGEEGAVSFVVRCPSCGTKNEIYVTKVLEIEVPRMV